MFPVRAATSIEGRTGDVKPEGVASRGVPDCPTAPHRRIFSQSPITRNGRPAGATTLNDIDSSLAIGAAPFPDPADDGEGPGIAGYAPLVRRQLELLGEDPARAGLQRTPQRVARAMAFLTHGYGLQVADVVGAGVFAEAHEHMVMVRDIELY
ncbi:MAG: GTP cyclohydrolase I, partial [Gemmatimonadaceae bacterium]|nr:GTP cyclohydrolase I [Gemmatimonadaceae bacterium]